MKKTIFPLNFFSSMFSVNKIFKNRNKYKLWQTIFIFIFITSLLQIPLLFSTLQRGSQIVTDFLPSEVHNFDKDSDVTNAIDELKFSDNRLTSSSKIISEKKNYIVGIKLPTEALNDKIIALNFLDNYVNLSVVKNKEQKVIHLKYTSNFIYDLQHKTICLTISKYIYHQNVVSVLFASFSQVSFILFLMNCILVIGVAILLYLTKNISNINSFKECVNLTASLMSGGAILALLLSFFSNNIFVLFGIQSLWMVVMTFNLYVKTRFRLIKSS